MSLSPAPDPFAEIALLRRQLGREQRARRTAEQVGEQSTAQLYDTVQELRSAQERLRQHLDDQLLINQLSMSVRQDLDPSAILRRAVSSIGAAVGADRCLIRFADGSAIGKIIEQWAAPGAPRLDSDVHLPTTLERLSLAAAGRRESLVIDDVLTDTRLSPSDAAAVKDELGSDSYLGAPMWMANHLVGWLVLHSTTGPQPWSERQLAVVEGIADALGVALMQSQAYAHQSQALERLQMVDRAKTEFILTVSHELRTPLTSISLHSELLSDKGIGSLTEDQLHLLEVVTRNTDRLLDLVGDLLSLARVDAGALVVVREEVDMRIMLDGARQALLPMAARRRLALHVDCDSAVPTVCGNPDELARVVLNVLSNAVKFTPDGGCVTATLATDGAATVLEVTDNGHGISEADLPYVFDRFYRASSASEWAIEGTGLGLAVVKSTVEQHGGTVTITSVPDRGTTVTISLPATPRLATTT